ncbi:DUF3828 domain-containing protein [Desulfovibrio litoralis]|uniref:Uncharacterized protein n=1 Tax=Desulfovibrio litoralis DSM 11393 TaxID=1121455 RepID=A0A1M7RU88_9BACT|nr:DUF3828 domain-containing protein [Desulfovibrio litoralis]SHN49887.1 Protein of unknown function [Desulfovibrio litoralis DSM 11393]
MKKKCLFKIVFISLLILVFNYALVFAQSLNPEKFVENFYQWYLENEMNVKIDDKAFAQYLSPCLIEQIKKSQSKGALPDGFNYFIKASDYNDEHPRKIKVHKATCFKDNVILVPVTFGEGFAYSVLVFLRKDGNALSIIKIAPTYSYGEYPVSGNPNKINASPEKFVENFYRWYLSNEHGENLPERNKEIYNYVFEATVEAVKARLGFYYTSYFTATAVNGADWENNIHVYQHITLPDNLIIVPVSFGKDKDTNVVVILSAEDKGLRITRVEDTWGYSAIP